MVSADQALLAPLTGPEGVTARRIRRAGCFALTALSRRSAGKIVSVHRRAVIVLLDSGSLVTLLPVDQPLHPWAISVPFVASCFSTGLKVESESDALTCGRFSFSWAGVPGTDLRLHIRPRRLAAGLEARLLGLARPVAGNDRCQAIISASLAQFGGGSGAGGLSRLVGLGEGLTPAGDDVIVGLLAGLDLAAAAGRGAIRRRQEVVASIPSPLRRHTTLLAAQMIETAVAGHYAEPVLNLLSVLARPDPGQEVVAMAVRRLLNMGHRSGGDTLRGIGAGLATGCSLWRSTV